MIVALAGGVGAGKFLRGLVHALPPAQITVVVNTGDDIWLHGLRVCPDLDSVTYAMAGAADSARGWGLAGETWQCLDGMRRYGMPTWFQLGDRDLATHIFRTQRLAAGASLADVTSEIASAWDLESRILPMTEDPVENRVVTVDGADLHFQEYLVQRHAADPVARVYQRGIDAAKPPPAVLDALEQADGIVFCPSNPVVSIGPILGLVGVRDAVERRQVRCVAISPIIAGAPVRGPADKLMPPAGIEVSAAGVAANYSGLIDTLVIDTQDSALVPAVEAHGVACAVTATFMTDVAASTRLARRVLELL